MEEVSIIGIDLAKRSFQVHGAKADASIAYRKKLSRGKVLSFLASQPGCTVAMEACGSAHYWGREIVRTMLQVAQAFFQQWCRAIAGNGVAVDEHVLEHDRASL